jgi:hypothetical protein
MRMMEGELSRRWREGLGADDHIALSSANVDSFPGLGTGLTLPGMRFVPDSASSFAAIRAGGLALSLDGDLVSVARPHRVVGQLVRHLDLAQGVAEHERVELEPRLRGEHRSVQALHRSIALYRELGIEDIYLNATEGGSYLWARCGFDFAHPDAREEVVEAASELLELLGFDLDLDWIEHSWDFFRIRGSVSLVDLVRAYEVAGYPLEDLKDLVPESAAVESGIALYRALLRAAPHAGWRGHFDLRSRSISYVQLEDYSRARAIGQSSA